MIALPVRRRCGSVASISRGPRTSSELPGKIRWQEAIEQGVYAIAIVIWHVLAQSALTNESTALENGFRRCVVSFNEGRQAADP